LEFFRKNYPPLPVLLFYLTMSVRLGLSTLYQCVRWLSGRASKTDLRLRWNRQLNFMAVRSDRRGLNPA
jgi:hypothetical protein